MEYFEDMYNIDTQEQVAVYMCGFEIVLEGGELCETRKGGEF